MWHFACSLIYYTANQIDRAIENRVGRGAKKTSRSLKISGSFAFKTANGMWQPFRRHIS